MTTSIHLSWTSRLFSRQGSHGSAGERCVQARCVVPQAMPVPLPYPGIFQPSVLRYGDLVNQDSTPDTNGQDSLALC